MAFFSFFFSSRRRHTRCLSDWSSDVCSSDLVRSLVHDTRPRVPGECSARPCAIKQGPGSRATRPLDVTLVRTNLAQGIYITTCRDHEHVIITLLTTS